MSNSSTNAEQVDAKRLSRRLELLLHRLQHGSKRSVRFAQLPHPRADRVEAEVHAARQVEDDGFALKFAEDPRRLECARIVRGRRSSRFSPLAALHFAHFLN